jgi:glycosyltransferase involved in cell wall biosynthesis
MTKPLKVIHLITGLGVGGAETMLTKIVLATPRDQIRPIVVSLTTGGDTRKVLEAADIEVFDLGMKAGRPNPIAIFRLVRILLRERPQILLTWLYHADFLGLIASRLFPKMILMWNLRCSNMGSSYYKGFTGRMVKLLARFSNFPDAVIVNSEAGRSMHADMGYNPGHWAVIPNGFDLEKLVMNSPARGPVLESIGIDPDQFVVGMVARFDPVKGHEVLLKAAARIIQVRDDVHFILVGADVTADSPDLKPYLTEQLEARISFLGQRTDIAQLNNAFDVAVSASHSEGFPNTIGEAMSCGTPCIVTDVGDCAAIVGDTGSVISTNDEIALADAILGMASKSLQQRLELGEKSRNRISQHYSIASVTRQYVELIHTRL